MRARFDRRPGPTTRALSLVEAAQRAYTRNAKVQDPKRKDYSTAKPLGPAKGPARATRTIKPRAAASRKLFKDFEAKKMGVKVQHLVAEIRLLNVDKCPHACALLVRSVIDIAVAQVFARQQRVVVRRANAIFWVHLVSRETRGTAESTDSQLVDHSNADGAPSACYAWRN